MAQYIGPTIEAQGFDDCYEYFEDKPPVPVSCDIQLLHKTIFFALVIALIGSGIVSLFKGVRGKWDQDVKPEDILVQEEILPSQINQTLMKKSNNFI